MKYDIFARRMAAKLGASAPSVSMFVFNQRDDRLRREGFLWYERFWLAQHAITSPAMRAMRRDRRNYFKKYGVGFDNFNDYQGDITNIYRQYRWYFKDGSPDPFQMLEWYRRQLPDQPETPQPKRRLHKKRENYKSKAMRSGSKPYG